VTTAPGAPGTDSRAGVAAFLSFLFPGLGQAYNRDARLAGLLAAPVLLVAGLVLLLVALQRSVLVAQLVNVNFLAALIVLDLALLGWRLIAIVQAYGRRERPSARRWTTWTAALLVAVTLGMHLVPAWYAGLAITTLENVTQGGTGTGGLTDRVPDLGGLPEPSDQPDVGRGERVNILLVGVDALPSRTTQLTDTMLVVSIDPSGGRSAMISIPRDLYGVPLPDGRQYNRKLNSLMVYAGSHPDEFPLGGVGTLKATIAELLGLPIHYFAAVNLLGFKDGINAIGGVEVTVTRAVQDATYRDEFGVKTGFYIQPGTYHMDGHLALAYVRSRKGVGDSDFTRADRQQQLLAAAREQLSAGNLLVSLPGLLAAVSSSVVTDIPTERMPDLALAVDSSDFANLERVVLKPPTYMTANPNSSAGYILIPNLEAIRSVAQSLLAPTAPEPSPTPGSAG